MLKTISWNQYFLFTGIIAVAWYAYVLLRSAGKSSGQKDLLYSAKDRTALFGDDESEQKAETVAGDPLFTSREMASAEEIDAIPEWGLMMQTITQEVKTAIHETIDAGTSSDELAARLRVILSNYPDLKRTAYGNMLTEFMLRESKAVGFDWTKEEAEDFWQ